MKHTIERVSPNSAAKVISVAAAFLFVFLIFVAVVLSVAQSSETVLGLNFSNISIMMIVMPFIYMIGVYIASYIGALAFNVATRLVGGIQLELSD